MDMTKFEDISDPGFIAIAGELRRWVRELVPSSDTHPAVRPEHFPSSSIAATMGVSATGTTIALTSSLQVRPVTEDDTGLRVLYLPSKPDPSGDSNAKVE